MFYALALMVAQAAPATVVEAQPIPPIDQAREQIAELDARLFWSAFEGCDARAIEDLITEDFRMLHDLAGLAVPDGASFVASMAEQCAAREPGGAIAGYKNRRLLVPGSRTVTPLGKWGVLERGHHTFQEWRGEKGEWEQTGGARYIHVWKWMADEGRFRLEQSLSIDHGAAPSYPPVGEQAD
ncbi:MAG: DUF4440 domain-containing protein [Pseudomonadota bacterium]